MIDLNSQNQSIMTDVPQPFQAGDVLKCVSVSFLLKPGQYYYCLECTKFMNKWMVTLFDIVKEEDKYYDVYRHNPPKFFADRFSLPDKINQP